MNATLENVRKAKNLDITVQIVSVDKTTGFRVLANLVEFENIDGTQAKVKKKAAAYHEDVNLDAAQNGAIERAANFLGL